MERAGPLPVGTRRRSVLSAPRSLQPHPGQPGVETLQGGGRPAHAPGGGHVPPAGRPRPPALPAPQGDRPHPLQVPDLLRGAGGGLLFQGPGAGCWAHGEAPLSKQPWHWEASEPWRSAKPEGSASLRLGTHAECSGPDTSCFLCAWWLFPGLSTKLAKGPSLDLRRVGGHGP